MSIFTEHIKSGRSLIFVQTALAHYKVIGALRVKLIPYFSTCEHGAMNALVKYIGHLPKNAALVCMLPALVTGVKIDASRVIWIEGDTYRTDDPIFDQAMWRVRGHETARLIITEADV